MKRGRLVRSLPTPESVLHPKSPLSQAVARAPVEPPPVLLRDIESLAAVEAPPEAFRTGLRRPNNVFRNPQEALDARQYEGRESGYLRNEDTGSCEGFLGIAMRSGQSACLIVGPPKLGVSEDSGPDRNLQRNMRSINSNRACLSSTGFT